MEKLRFLSRCGSGLLMRDLRASMNFESLQPLSQYQTESLWFCLFFSPICKFLLDTVNSHGAKMLSFQAAQKEPRHGHGQEIRPPRRHDRGQDPMMAE